MDFEVKDINFSADSLEQLGTKEKFWFYFGPKEELAWLFKYSRENTGEHWSEKIAEQLCEALKIPHVGYELAVSNERFGIISPSAIPKDCRMVMGNEVLHADSPTVYPKPLEDSEQFVRVKEHTVSRVLGCLDRSGTLPPITDFDLDDLNAGDVFCGYLMLDALISNQDRHHENWAIILDNEVSELRLCPTYDHAASLGRELLDDERVDRLCTKDQNRQISKFVRRARSELFRLKTDKKPLFTVDAFYSAVDKRKRAKNHWLLKLNELSPEMIESIFSRVPKEMISEPAREFAFNMVLENRKRLLEYDGE